MLTVLLRYNSMFALVALGMFPSSSPEDRPSVGVNGGAGERRRRLASPYGVRARACSGASRVGVAVGVINAFDRRRGSKHPALHRHPRDNARRERVRPAACGESVRLSILRERIYRTGTGRFPRLAGIPAWIAGLGAYLARLPCQN